MNSKQKRPSPIGTYSKEDLETAVSLMFMGMGIPWNDFVASFKITDPEFFSMVASFDKSLVEPVETPRPTENIVVQYQTKPAAVPRPTRTVVVQRPKRSIASVPRPSKTIAVAPRPRTITATPQQTRRIAAASQPTKTIAATPQQTRSIVAAPQPTITISAAPRPSKTIAVASRPTRPISAAPQPTRTVVAVASAAAASSRPRRAIASAAAAPRPTRTVVAAADATRPTRTLVAAAGTTRATRTVVAAAGAPRSTRTKRPRRKAKKTTAKADADSGPKKPAYVSHPRVTFADATGTRTVIIPIALLDDEKPIETPKVQRVVEEAFVQRQIDLNMCQRPTTSADAQQGTSNELNETVMPKKTVQPRKLVLPLHKQVLKVRDGNKIAKKANKGPRKLVIRKKVKNPKSKTFSEAHALYLRMPLFTRLERAGQFFRKLITPV